MKHHLTCYDLIVFPKHYIYFLKRSQTSCFICISIILHILEVSLIIKGLKKSKCIMTTNILILIHQYNLMFSCMYKNVFTKFII